MVSTYKLISSRQLQVYTGNFISYTVCIISRVKVLNILWYKVAKDLFRYLLSIIAILRLMDDSNGMSTRFFNIIIAFGALYPLYITNEMIRTYPVRLHLKYQYSRKNIRIDPVY